MGSMEHFAGARNSLAGRVDVGGEVTAKNIMIATGSVPFVPPGIPIDGKTVSPDVFLALP